MEFRSGGTCLQLFEPDQVLYYLPGLNLELGLIKEA